MQVTNAEMETQIINCEPAKQKWNRTSEQREGVKPQHAILTGKATQSSTIH